MSECLHILQTISQHRQSDVQFSKVNFIQLYVSKPNVYFLFTLKSPPLLKTSVLFSFNTEIKNITWNIMELVTEERCVSHVCHRLLLVLFEIRSVLWRWFCQFIAETQLMHSHPAWKNAGVRRENFIHITQIRWNMKKRALKFKKKIISFAGITEISNIKFNLPELYIEIITDWNKGEILFHMKWRSTFSFWD